MTKYAWPWDQESESWSLAAAPRYQVRDFTLSRPVYLMLVDGQVVDEAGDRETAFAQLEARYEYEEHAADLELARLRLHQAEQRILARFPNAGRDGQLASILEGLGDALGAGPEASDPDYLAARETDIWRAQISPVLWVAVEASTNVVLEVTTPHGRVTARILVGVVALGDALGHAATLAAAAADEAEQARLRGIDDRRRSEGRLTRAEAVEYIIGAGVGEGRAGAVVIVNWLADGSPDRCWDVAGSAAAMTYDGTYWTVPVNTEQPAR